MQGRVGGIRAKIKAQERRKLEALRVAAEADAEIDRLIAIDRVEHKTPDERRADIRRRNTRGVRKILAAVGALSLAEFLRSHRRAAVASAMAAGAAGAVAVAPGSTDMLDLVPDEPPSVVATPSPRVAEPDAHPKGGGVVSPVQPTPGGPPGDGAPGRSGSGDPPGEGVPEPAPSSAVATTPPPPSTQPPPAPPDEPSTPEPQSSPTPEPTPTPEPEPEPEPEMPPPVPSATAGPPTVTMSPEEEPLCVEVDELLGVCADLELPTLDGLIGGRTFRG